MISKIGGTDPTPMSLGSTPAGLQPGNIIQPGPIPSPTGLPSEIMLNTKGPGTRQTVGAGTLVLITNGTVRINLDQLDAGFDLGISPGNAAFEIGDKLRFVSHGSKAGLVRLDYEGDSTFDDELSDSFSITGSGSFIEIEVVAEDAGVLTWSVLEMSPQGVMLF